MFFTCQQDAATFHVLSYTFTYFYYATVYSPHLKHLQSNSQDCYNWFSSCFFHLSPIFTWFLQAFHPCSFIFPAFQCHGTPWYPMVPPAIRWPRTTGATASNAGPCNVPRAWSRRIIVRWSVFSRTRQGFHRGTPNSWMVYVMENAVEMDENWGYPYFGKPPYIYIYNICIELLSFSESFWVLLYVGVHHIHYIQWSLLTSFGLSEVMKIAVWNFTNFNILVFILHVTIHCGCFFGFDGFIHLGTMRGFIWGGNPSNQLMGVINQLITGVHHLLWLGIPRNTSYLGGYPRIPMDEFPQHKISNLGICFYKIGGKRNRPKEQHQDGIPFSQARSLCRQSILWFSEARNTGKSRSHDCTSMKSHRHNVLACESWGRVDRIDPARPGVRFSIAAVPTATSL